MDGLNSRQKPTKLTCSFSLIYETRINMEKTITVHVQLTPVHQESKHCYAGHLPIQKNHLSSIWTSSTKVVFAQSLKWEFLIPTKRPTIWKSTVTQLNLTTFTILSAKFLNSWNVDQHLDTNRKNSWTICKTNSKPFSVSTFDFPPNHCYFYKNMQ